MKQERLDELNTEVVNMIQMFVSGMITIVEFTDAMANMKRRIGEDGDLAGLLDPNTGLRFPTKEETDEFMAKFDRTADGMTIYHSV